MRFIVRPITRRGHFSFDITEGGYSSFIITEGGYKKMKLFTVLAAADCALMAIQSDSLL
jgi:hypothetical protein